MKDIEFEKEKAKELGFNEGKRYAEMWTGLLEALSLMCERRAFKDFRGARCAFC